MPDQMLAEDPVLSRVAAARTTIAEEALSPGSARAAAIAERVISTAADTARGAARQPRTRRGISRQTGAVLSTVAIGAVAVVLALVLSRAGTGTIPTARAAIARMVVRALTPRSGTIVIERLQVSVKHKPNITETDVSESANGDGAQNSLVIIAGAATRTDPFAIVNGDEEIYSRTRRTIYISSIYGPYIHRDPQAGTYVYRPTHDHGSPTAYERQSLTLNARQLAALRSGSAAIVVGENRASGGRLQLVAAPRNPTRVDVIRQQIAAGDLLYSGHMTIRGRRVIVFRSPAHVRPDDPASAPGRTLYIDPRTYAPVEDVSTQLGFREVVTWAEYRTLPVTATSRQLLSLHHFFPAARVVRSHSAYLRAAGRLTVYSG